MDNYHDNLRLLLRHVLPELPGGWIDPQNLQLWSPPEDPDRPDLPYIPGFTAQIEPHEAPPPSGDESLYGPCPRRDLSDVDLETVTQSALVVSHPPLETTSIKSPAGSIGIPEVGQDQTAQLTITSPIRVGYDSGAQIVVCTVTQAGKQPFHAVAKIFDALYYRFRGHLAPKPRDITAEADKDYTTEAAAYKRLADAGETGVSAPKYYGSWTLKLPITSRGNSMHDDGPDAYHIPEEYRLEVLAQALDSYVRMLHWGVEQGDLSPRNVMLVTDTTRPIDDSTVITVPRVVLIDYNVAIVHSRTIRGKHPHESLARPINPMEWFWLSLVGGDFEGWIPQERRESHRLLQEWLTRRFGTEDQRALYEPVTKDLQFHTR